MTNTGIIGTSGTVLRPFENLMFEIGDLFFDTTRKIFYLLYTIFEDCPFYDKVKNRKSVNCPFEKSEKCINNARAWCTRSFRFGALYSEYSSAEWQIKEEDLSRFHKNLIKMNK